VPYAGLVVGLDAWRQAGTPGEGLREHTAALAAAAFPRPVLVEIADLDPPRYEAFQERGARGGPVDARELPALLGAALEDLELVRAVAESLGATNLHLIAPFVKSAHDARLLRACLESTGLGGAPGLRTLVFAELRNPSTLLFNAAFAKAQDGMLVRANRFYKALLREGESGPPPSPGAADTRTEASPTGSASFVQSLVRVTRGFENAGGTVLVLLEDAADLGTLWFYHELGVDGFVTRLKDAEACMHALAELERQPAAPERRGKLR
jgi:hypothetical protein